MFIFLILGFVTSVFQIVILREFTFCIAKNELTLSFSIGIWLLFCALASNIGKRHYIPFSKHFPFFLSLIYCLSILASHIAKPLLSIGYYETCSITTVLALSLFIIGISGFMAGYCFSVFANTYIHNNSGTTKTFSMFFCFEAIGAFIGGLFFTFVFKSYTNPFMFGLLPLLFIPQIIRSRKHFLHNISFVLILSCLCSVLYNNILKKELNVNNIILNKGTSYGSVIYAQKDNGTKELFLNGSLILDQEFLPWDEQFIFTILSASRTQKDILIIGLIDPDQIEQLLHYTPNSITIVTINPIIAKMIKDSLHDIKGNVFIETDDPHLFIARSEKKFDIILSNIDSPNSISNNRFFTIGFFEIAKKHLKTNGLFAFHIPSKQDILSPRILDFNACILNTVKHVFKYPFIVPGDTMLILCPLDYTLSPEKILSDFEKESLKTKYFTSYELKDSLFFSNREYVINSLNKTTRINTSLFPSGFLYFSLMEQARFYPNIFMNVPLTSKVLVSLVFLLSIFLVIFSLVFRQYKIRTCASLVGFSSMAISTVILFLFQTFSGELYWKIGILTGLFMLGLSFGSYLMSSLIKHFNKVMFFSWIIRLIFFALFFVSLPLANYSSYMQIILYSYVTIFGILTGIMYPIFFRECFTGESTKENISATIYAYDTAGAFLGSVLFSVLVIPFLGIRIGIIVLVFLQFLGFFITLIK
ncbi:MAG: hypothetical protein PHQ52_02115 [Candidatus Omnitrophica bacterium]|nr:hypothetical protein [Candidatus Omnitrophota bacterium]